MSGRTLRVVAVLFALASPTACIVDDNPAKLTHEAHTLERTDGPSSVVLEYPEFRTAGTTDTADNLNAAVEDRLSPEQVLAISGNGADKPGIDANNRLIWGQVFLWPEADGDWRVLWDDSQVFETADGYMKFKKSSEAHYKVWQDTTYRG